MIWNEEMECMDPEERKELQLKRLKETVKRAEKIPFYKERFEKLGLSSDSIETLEDIQKFPFTTKDDLRSCYPFDLVAADPEDIVEIHSSSGTTGTATVTCYTQKDLDIWGEITARAIGMAGGEKKDKIQNCYGYGLFTGGFGIDHGGKKFGATVIPMSAGNTKRQLEIMRDFKSNILTCTPSYAIYLGESLEEEGYGPDDINLKSGIFGAEMWTEEMRHRIEEKLGIKALNIYGLTEVMGPGVSSECMEQDGMHIQEDHFYPEIINPKTEEVLGDNQKGELVLTCITKTGMPIIRFRTKDVTSLNHEKCKCGRTTVRMHRVTGRTDDMLKIRGVMVFPSQIERALLRVSETSPNYQIHVTRPGTLDELEVKVEVTPEMFSDEMRQLDEKRDEIRRSISKEIGLRVNVTFVEPGSLPRSEGKAVRVIDERNFD
jgi:phenylacetate-CoA ligase